jgi:hypothetical protein
MNGSKRGQVLIGQTQSADGPMKKILVIEGGAEMRRNLTTILRLEKFHPLSAENGRVGVGLAKTKKPDGGVLASPQLRRCLAWEGTSYQ